jgi:Abnormal spindle-like microcephaly-assoc'd, ASPM-SPD-2-Hydin
MKFGHGSRPFSVCRQVQLTLNSAAKILSLLAISLLAAHVSSEGLSGSVVWAGSPPAGSSGLVATPSGVSFGNVPVGANYSQTIRVANDLGVATNLGLTLSGPGFRLTDVPSSSTVAAGGSIGFNVVFTPPAVANYSATVLVISDGKVLESIPVSGSGVKATLSLSVSTSSVNFGDKAMNAKSLVPVTVTSTGNSTVTISSVSVSGNEFGASGIPDGTVLKPGQSVTMDAIFSPSEAGVWTGKVTIASNASNSPVVALSGTASAAATAAATAPSVTLKWNSVSEAKGYYVYRGTKSGGPYTKLNASAITLPDYVDSAASSGQTYYYVVTDVNSALVQSSYSNQAEATIPGSAGGETAPETVSLHWAGASGAVGYYVYRGSKSGGPYVKLNSAAVTVTDYTDGAVSAGQTYYYVVTSVNSAQVQSSYSNQAEASISN